MINFGSITNAIKSAPIKILKWFWKEKAKIINALAIFIAILGIGIIDIFKPLILDLPIIKRVTNEKKVERIKVGYSKEYVEDLMGIPQRSRALYFTNSEGGKYKFTRVDYIEDDYLYSLFYREDESILGYGLISKNKKFNPKLPFKDTPSLLESKQDSFLDVTPGEVRFTTYSFSGTRSDVSNYEMDFSYGHLFTNNLIIGYGVSEFGYQRKDVLFDYISNYIWKAPLLKENYSADTYSLVGDYITTFDELVEDGDTKGIKSDVENDYRKQLYPNSIFVIDADFSDEYDGNLYSNDIAFEFIVEQLEFGFLYNRDEFYSITENSRSY